MIFHIILGTLSILLTTSFFNESKLPQCEEHMSGPNDAANCSTRMSGLLLHSAESHHHFVLQALFWDMHWDTHSQILSDRLSRLDRRILLEVLQV